MDRMAPDGDVYQAGTLSGNPLAMASGLASLKLLMEPGFHDELEKKSAWFWEQVRRLVAESGQPGTVNAVGSMGTLFFNSGPVRNFADAMASDSERFIRVYGAMIEKGVYLAPSPFEATFVSAAHSQEDLEKALKALESALHGLR